LAIELGKLLQLANGCWQLMQHLHVATGPERVEPKRSGLAVVIYAVDRSRPASTELQYSNLLTITLHNQMLHGV